MTQMDFVQQRRTSFAFELARMQMASWTWAKPTGGCGMGELLHVMHGSRSTFVEMVFVQQHRTTFAFELALRDRINILVMVARDVHVIETATWKVIADNLARLLTLCHAQEKRARPGWRADQ